MIQTFNLHAVVIGEKEYIVHSVETYLITDLINANNMTSKERHIFTINLN